MYTKTMTKINFLTSRLLTQAGVKHGWFMRYGGVSEGLFESLNGKKGGGDTDQNVDENSRRTLLALFPAALDTGVGIAHIVHEFKTRVVFTESPGTYKGYDASITNKNNVVLSQTTADCGTVIIASSSGAVVALVHGSWHTLSAKMICDVVAKVKSLSNSEELIAGIGPMICGKCYEFGAEAKQLFDSRYLTPHSDKFLVNLKQMIVEQLSEAGVSQFDDVNICTKEDQRFFSHRNNGAHSGRFITLAHIK